MKKIQRISVIFLPLFLFFAANLTTGQTNGEYVGSETCLECHDDIYPSLKKTAHVHVTLDRNSAEVESCEACHGPGDLHIEDPEIKGSIRSFTETDSGESTSACLSCHRSNSSFKRFQNQRHYQAGESCTTCHSVHQTTPRKSLLAIQPEELCFSCHQEKESAFSLPFHHKVKEGRMTCWSCHDPHNVDVSPQNIGQKSIDEQCSTCHPAQRGPFTHEHLAVNAGGCRVCHKPHGSENARLLKRANQALLCLECHSGPSVSDQLLGPKTPSFHITSKAAYQSCTVCHVRIHGSYLDSHFIR